VAEPTGLEHLTPVVIESTSATERAGFRKCRRQWFLTTVHRLDSNTGNIHFFLGNIYHAALAAYYAAQWAGDPVEEMELKALDTFQDEYHDQMAKLEKQIGFLWGFTKETFIEAAELGLEMLYNYMERERLDPLFDEVIAVEFRVNVPIHDYKDEEVGILSVQTDVVGRKDGELGVADHKTASRVMPSAHLDLDDQLTAEVYSWWLAWDEFPEKAIYNVSYKKAPKPPKLIRKGTALSKAKNQATTAALYRAEIHAHGFDVKDYVDVLAALEERDSSGENTLFRREAVFRTPGQMEAFRRDLYHEWQDMVDVATFPAKAYPNPTSMNCGGCHVRSICTTIQDGGDVEAVIKAGYIIADPRR
jgi:hypothetical protein